MSKSFKVKNQNLIPRLSLKQTKQEKMEIPHPKNNKLKIYKSGRPFGKDVTNTLKQNYPLMPINSFNPSNIPSKVRQLIKQILCQLYNFIYSLIIILCQKFIVQAPIQIIQVIKKQIQLTKI